MKDFLIKIFLKNPIGLTITGIIVSLTFGIGILEQQDTPAWIFVGNAISLIGIIWFIKNKKKVRDVMNIYTPVYLEVINALKDSGYEVKEFENKNNLIRTSVLVNGNNLGEVFLVAPPPGGKYEQFRRIANMTDKDFKYAYSKKFGKNPGMAAYYWPVDSFIGSFIEESAENSSEKEKWLIDVKNILNDKLSK
ncbi:MAG: hypothetical protein FWD40_11780 [Treponema sp.]|nr:hypothetical protein [Treponema sp.]